MALMLMLMALLALNMPDWTSDLSALRSLSLPKSSYQRESGWCSNQTESRWGNVVSECGWTAAGTAYESQ